MPLAQSLALASRNRILMVLFLSSHSNSCSIIVKPSNSHAPITNKIIPRKTDRYTSKYSLKHPEITVKGK